MITRELMITVCEEGAEAVCQLILPLAEQNIFLLQQNTILLERNSIQDEKVSVLETRIPRARNQR